MPIPGRRCQVPKGSKLSCRAYLCSISTLFTLAGCANRTVNFIHPQTGASAQCGASGFGIGASFTEGLVSGCSRAWENRGYVQLDQLTPEQRENLERRGLLPKP